MDQGVKVKWVNETSKKTVGTTWGVPWGVGELQRDEELKLISSTNELLPLQSWPLAFWPDGSIKWSAHSTVLASKAKEHFYVSKGQSKRLSHALVIKEMKEQIEVNTGQIIVKINKSGTDFIQNIYSEGKLICTGGRLICIKEKQKGEFGQREFKEELFESKITKVKVEQKGNVRAVVKIEGVHKASKGEKEWLPFNIRLYFYVNTASIRLVHNFIYDGDANTDFIKGLGIDFSVPITGEAYNRQVRFAGDTGLFSETCQFISRCYE
jgi:hypothetical protein